MKFNVAVYILISWLLMSCNSNVREGNISGDNSLPAQEKNNTETRAQQKIVFVDSSVFLRMLKALPDDAMRREGEQRLMALKHKTRQAEKVPLNSIVSLFKRLMESYPLQPHDKFLLKLSKAYEDVDESNAALNSLDQIVALYPGIMYLDEVQFRRGNILFSQRRFLKSEQAYKQVIDFRNSVHYEQAVYQQGWAQYKQTHYGLALNSFMHLLDIHSREGDLVFKKMGPTEKKFIEDVMLAVTLCFDAQAGPRSARHYFSNKQKRKYEYYVFISLAKFYQKRMQITDAVNTYRLFVELNELHIKSPVFLVKVIDLYRQYGFDDELLSAKKDFVLRYPAKHVYWGLHPKSKTTKVFSVLKNALMQLADFYDSRIKSVTSDSAQNKKLQNKFIQVSEKSQNAALEQFYYRESQRWSRLFLNAFPDDTQAWRKSLQLAQAFRGHKNFELAALQYERTAYDYKVHAESADAAYAALLMYQKRQNELSGFAGKYWHKLFMDSAQRFVTQFSDHPQAVKIKSNISGNEYVDGDYDAAFKWLGLRDWEKAQAAFESLRDTASQQILQIEITKKLAQVYLQNFEYKKAIVEFNRISYFPDVPNHQMDALWQAAELSELINNNKQAIKFYSAFIKRFPFPLQRSIEAHQRLIAIYERTGEPLLATEWRVRLVNSDAQGGKYRTEISRMLAAKARLSLVQPNEESYRNARLHVPLNESLKIKNELMDEVIKAYKRAASYNISQVSTVATYQIAEINLNMSQAIIGSERPPELSLKQLKAYDHQLIEKAHPYKQNAIRFYEVNVARVADGVDDAWVQKSLVRLKELFPERYGGHRVSGK